MSALKGALDSHCHLDMLPRWRRDVAPDPAEAEAEIEAVLARARAAGVEQFLVPGCAWQDHAGVRDLTERYPPVWAAYGIHPHDASTWPEGGEARLEQAMAHPKAVAIGECGLDYHYDLSPRGQQRDAFRAQIRLARKLGKPLVIHTREAEADTLAIMVEEKAAEVGGVMHCFTGSLELAREAVALGFHVSFSGILAFPKSHDLRAVARAVPLDRTLAETDAPYLAPPPHRGKRNEPAFVVRVIETLAEIHGLDAQEVAHLTARNARELFRLPVS